MGIYMAAEYAAFEKEQKILQKQYRENGMTENQIRELYEYDREQLNRDLAYRRRSCPLEEWEETGAEENLEDRLELLDRIEDEVLWRALKRLSAEEMSLLEQIVVDGIKQREYAKIHRISVTTVNSRLRKIERKLRMEMSAGKIGEANRPKKCA